MSLKLEVGERFSGEGADVEIVVMTSCAILPWGKVGDTIPVVAERLDGILVGR